MFPLLLAIIAGLAWGFLLHLTRFTFLANYMGLFIATTVALLIWDMTSKFMVRGGHGIAQVELMGTGTRTVPKTTVFLALLVITPIVGIIIDQLSEHLTQLIQARSFGFISDLMIGLSLSFLVYLDMETKFYGS